MRLATPFLAGLLLPAAALAQPIVDGNCADASYQTLATTTSNNNGFDSASDLGALRYSADGTNIYLCITGDLEGNGNGYAVFMNAAGYNGVDAGLALPAGGPGFFTAAGGTILDDEADYAFFVNRSGTTSYIDGVRYGEATVLGGAYGGAVNDNQSATVDAAALFGGSGTGTGTQAFRTGYDAATMPNNGYEIRIPLSALPGVLATDQIRFFVAIASGGAYFSNELLPDRGYDGTADAGQNFGIDPNFDAAATGDPLYTGFTNLPVELSSFTGVADGRSAVLSWTTESETDNAGFSVEALRGAAWNEVAFVAGRGTTSERASYERRIDGLTPGRHTFRLVQRDLDGTSTVAGNVEVEIAPEGAFAITERRVGSTVVLGLVAREMQDVTVDAFDVTGRRVARLFDGHVHGSSDVAFETAGLPSGVYLVRVTGERASATHSVVIAR